MMREKSKENHAKVFFKFFSHQKRDESKKTTLSEIEIDDEDDQKN